MRHYRFGGKDSSRRLAVDSHQSLVGHDYRLATAFMTVAL